MTETCDVAVIGAGPAGLAAATELKRLGIGRVVVFERFGVAGGIPRHCGHPPFGMREFARVLTGPAYARRLVRRAERAGVEIRLNHTVTAIGAGGRLTVASLDGAGEIAAGRVLLATGNRERTRAQRLVPGLRPVGVMNTAALQSFLYEEDRVPFRRPVIFGSELVSLSAVLSCRRHGIRPVALVETGGQVKVPRPFLLMCRALGVPVIEGAQLVSIEGQGRVSGVRLRDAAGRDLQLAADGVIFSGQFTPEATLARASGLALDPGTLGPSIDPVGRSSDPHVFVAGNVLHPVETAGFCWAEGRRVARIIAADLRGPGAAAPARQSIRAGAGIRYVVPQTVTAAGPVRLNIRAEGAAKGHLYLRDAAGRTIACRRVHGHPEKPLRLDVPALDGDALAGALSLTLERET
ncbi:NAD(P)/FAD-dependent oxidoreductase [Frigidibacter sp. MR17.24]|uniref:NAD(P)/FAD-dependent oxidoreductase n=1 Tax=Frigidibacter sp. MR17.24 TaxID=3127345 RepID=UPI0030131D4E